MSLKTLDGKRFAEMIIQGANHLAANAKYVDALNVFPVPDGDTGTNMNLSMSSGAKEVRQNIQTHIGKVGIALSKGLLMGARGNSGVILSQLFRGFSKAIEQKAIINSMEFARAFEAGVEAAYKAVMKPIEGTILTVAKDAAKKAVQTASKHDDIVTIMDEMVKEAKASLHRTPELLPVLKEVGVVDSGGQGLVFIYEGFLAQLKGEALPDALETQLTMDELISAEHHRSVQGHISTDEIVYGYCTEFTVRLDHKKPFSEEQFRQELSRFGDSLLVIADNDLVKIHIHSEEPGNVLNYGQSYGSLINMKIENMREQHSTIVGETHSDHKEAKKEASKEKQKYGIVTVSMGSGFAELFRSIGAHEVIEGGQTMNPSTEDIVKAVNSVHAENVIILPNNKNILMAAKQAAEVCDCKVVVIPSKTVPQGIAALLSYQEETDIETNEKRMTEALANVKTGQITFAVRDTMINGLAIEKDDYMGILDGDIVVKDKDMSKTANELLMKMIDKDTEIVTIYTGEDASEEEVEAMVSLLENTYPDVEVEVLNGNQPLYPYIFSVE